MSLPPPPTVGLNGVRPRRPEQCGWLQSGETREHVSMESGLEDRNNAFFTKGLNCIYVVSMESGLEDRNNIQ